MCWASETSPLYAIKVLSPTGKIRWISLKRARLPKLAAPRYIVRITNVRRGGVCTEIVSCEDDAVVVFHGKDTCGHNLGLLRMCHGHGRGICRAMEGRLDGLHWVHVKKQRGRHCRGDGLCTINEKADAAMELHRVCALIIHS